MFKEADPFHYATVELALFSTYTIETLDDWEAIYRISMYGCGEYPGYYPKTTGINNLECNGNQGLGWIAALYFIFVVIFGGLVLPTMLIGIVAVSFEESFRKTESERVVMVRSSSAVLVKQQTDVCFPLTNRFVHRLKATGSLISSRQTCPFTLRAIG